MTAKNDFPIALRTNLAEGKHDSNAVADILDGAIVEIIDPRLASAQIDPNTGEEEDAAIPKNLHNAVELFLQTCKIEAAQQLQRCLAVFFALIEGRCPDAESRVGRACVCWQCGYCGIGRRFATDAPATETRTCNQCGESQQTNFVRIVSREGVAVSWKEVVQKELVSECRVALKGDAEVSALADAVTKSVTLETNDKNVGPASEQSETAATEAAIAATTSQELEAKLRPVDPRLQSILVTPNKGEDSHPRFPRNLLTAAEIFRQVRHFEAALNLQQCTEEFLSILDEGPAAAGNSGQGFTCFHCGYCGLASNDAKDDSATEKACKCTSCGEGFHTNFIQLVLPNGQELPWMTRATKVVNSNRRVKPNEPCPCGSGKKAKKCCHSGGVL